MKKILSLLIVIALPVSGEEKPSKELLRDGLFEEEVNQDFAKAEAAYRSVTKRFDKERYFAGLAFFRLAEIARKSGRQEEAFALYRRVAHEFSDQKEIAQRAAEQLGEEAPNINRVAAADPLITPPGNAEGLELKRLKKVERDSPDLLNGVGEDGLHPLHQAAANGWINAVDYLLERKVDIDPRTSMKTDYRSKGFTPLHLAVIHGHLTVVDRLLASKADPSLIVDIKPADLPLPVHTNSISKDSQGDWSALHLSILYQRREIMRRLLTSKGPQNSSGPCLTTFTINYSVSGKGSRGFTTWKFEASPLMLAVWLNDRVALKAFVDHKADFNQAVGEKGETPLLAAIWRTPELVPFLIKNGARVTDDFIFGKTALHWAASKCKPPVILQLIENGADVNLRVEKGEQPFERNATPLELTMAWHLEKEERHEVCLALLKAGARPTTNALTSATAYDQLDIMEALLDAKVDLNGGNDEGNRPLHYAKSAEAAKLLLDSGALLEVKNHEGVTPFGKIVNLDDTPKSRALIDFLISKGADTSMLSYYLFSIDDSYGDRPLLPYVMSKTKLVGQSDPKTIKLAFPRNWSVTIGADKIFANTPPPGLREFLCLNFQSVSQKRSIPASNSTSSRVPSRSNRYTQPPVVTDLIIYRPNEQGGLAEVALINADTPHPKLEWGDIVLLRLNIKSSGNNQLPLAHYVSGVPTKTITLKVGPWEHKVRMENTHQTASGLELTDHFPERTSPVEQSKIILRRANGKSKTFDLTLPTGPQKIPLMDGDTIEYLLKPQIHHSKIDPRSPNTLIHLFFPDRPSFSSSEGRGKQHPLVDLLHGYALLKGRDLSRVTIQRMGEEKLERIPVDLIAASRLVGEGKDSITKATELLKTTIFPGDILIFPPKENLSWSQLNSLSPATDDPEIGDYIKLVKPTPRPRPKSPVVKPTSSRQRLVPKSSSR